jgi:hypothetical protein
MNGLFSPEHVQLIGLIVLPLGSGIGVLIWRQARMALKVDTMWGWYTNHGSDITGYKKPDK